MTEINKIDKNKIEIEKMERVQILKMTKINEKIKKLS